MQEKERYIEIIEASKSQLRSFISGLFEEPYQSNIREIFSFIGNISTLEKESQLQKVNWPMVISFGMLDHNEEISALNAEEKKKLYTRVSANIITLKQSFHIYGFKTFDSFLDQFAESINNAKKAIDNKK
jgi:hypothetical protein